MTEYPLTSKAMSGLQQIVPNLRSALIAFNEFGFNEGRQICIEAGEVLGNVRLRFSNNEALLNELFVIERYLDLFSKYGLLWEQITAQDFSASWNTLQDELDLLRVIKQFSALDVSYFENQLIELEQAYPYQVFCSIGATVSWFECSICRCDIDSVDCPHRSGHLYGGKMAYAIARDLKDFDHIALVLNPDDKRCVIVYENTSEAFRLIRYIAESVCAREFRISDFTGLKWLKQKRPNPEYVSLRRNDKCFCKSGKKFKHCCISKKELEGDHVEVICEPREIQDAFSGIPL
jgi:hypothetical protein